MGLRRGQYDVLADLQPSNDEVREELDRILRSRIFRGSKRCQEFLQFVVKSALDGESERLKERIIAVEVFGRKAGAGFADDSIVRVGAREVRKRLEQYYFTSGIRNAVRISIPPGSYVPAFQRAAPADLDVEAEAEGATPAADKRAMPWTVAFALGALLTLSVFAAAARLGQREPADFAAFWKPAFTGTGTALIAVASEPGVSSEAVVDFGDSVAAFRLGNLFARSARPVRLQNAASVEYPALLNDPAVLAGSFSNRWTMETMKSLPYRFVMRDGAGIIADAAGQRNWTIGAGPGEYLIICRLIRPDAGGPLVVAAGLTSQGTEEASRIVSEADVLAPLLERLPANWRDRSVEMVIRSGRTPQLVASQVW